MSTARNENYSSAGILLQCMTVSRLMKKYVVELQCQQNIHQVLRSTRESADRSEALTRTFLMIRLECTTACRGESSMPGFGSIT